MNFVYFFSDRRTSLLRGVVAAVLGCFLLFYPSFTSGLIIKLIAAFLIATGLATLLFAYRSLEGENKTLPTMVIINVTIYLVFGILIFVYPNFFLELIAFLFGAVLLVCGISQIAGLVMAAKSLKVQAALYFMPVIITVSGIVLFFAPGLSTKVLTMIFGAEVLLYGISELFTAWKLKNAEIKQN